MRPFVADLVIAACALTACSGTPTASALPHNQTAILSARPMRAPIGAGEAVVSAALGHPSRSEPHPGDDVVPTVEVQPKLDAADAGPNRRDADAEASGNRGVVQALGDEQGDLPLARREPTPHTVRLERGAGRVSASSCMVHGLTYAGCEPHPAGDVQPAWRDGSQAGVFDTALCGSCGHTE
jgi:hypothetical protein